MGQRQVAIVTGANTGIGKETARALARAGFHTVLACRNLERAEAAAESIRRALPDADLVCARLDLGDFASVEQFVSGLEYERISVLVNNAGYLPASRVLLAPGLEQSMCVNHFGPFLLTARLLERLSGDTSNASVGQPHGRIVNVASSFHQKVKSYPDDLTFEHSFTPYAAYNTAKLANIMFTRTLARKLLEHDADVTCNACHPGIVRTEFGSESKWYLRLGIALARPFLLSPVKGAANSVFLATDEAVSGVSGKYFVRKREKTPSAIACDEVAGEELWALSQELTGNPFAFGNAGDVGIRSVNQR